MHQEIDAQFSFVKLLHKVTGEYANWSPRGAKMKVGDYGTIDPESGAFRYEGSIYKILELACSAPLLSPSDCKDGDEFVVVSSNAKKLECPTNIFGNVSTVASASLKGQWKFGDESGALLVVHRPRHRSLPYGTIVTDIINHPQLEGKLLVTEVVTCPAYARYSHDKGEGEVSLALEASVNVPHSPVSVGFEVAPQWHHTESCGVWDSGTDGLPSPSGRKVMDRDTYTVLYTLTECKASEPEPDVWSRIFGKGSPRRPRLALPSTGSSQSSRSRSPSPSPSCSSKSAASSSTSKSDISLSTPHDSPVVTIGSLAPAQPPWISDAAMAAVIETQQKWRRQRTM